MRKQSDSLSVPYCVDGSFVEGPTGEVGLAGVFIRTASIWKSSCRPRAERKHTNKMLLNKINAVKPRFLYHGIGRRLKKF